MTDTTRRQILATGAMAVAATASQASPARKGDHLAIPAPDVVTLPIVGSDKRFPVRRIYCVGRNYLAHVVELNNNTAEPPFFFQKQRDMIVQPGGKVRYPALTADFEYETELVVAMKSGGMDIDREAANVHIFGYAVGFDMTRRDRQADMKRMQKPWEIGKSFEDSAPCGAITPAAKSGFLERGEIKLLVNGEVRQQSNLDRMIWNVPMLIAALSKEAELRAGDLIYTGTPEGVGPVKRGDRMQGTVDGLSTLVVDIV